MSLNENSKSTYIDKKQSKKMLEFIGAACSFAAVYAASSAPIPFYTTYQKTIGLTNGDLSMTSVAYFIGTVISLLIFARLSNYLGRRPVVFTVLGLAVIGCLMFFFMHNSAMFLIGRLIQGISCGLGSSVIAAYIVDNAPETPEWLGTAVTSAAPMIGLAGGAFGAGALKQYGGSSISLIFGILIVVIVLCAAMVLMSPETVTRTNGAAKSLIPQIRVPKNIRYLLPAASATFIGTWAIGGFYQAFSSPMAVQQLNSKNTMVAAAVFACMMAPNIIGSTLAGRMKTAVAQRVGMVVFFISLLIIIFSLKAGAVVLFLIAGVFAGAAWGIAFTGSMRGILNKTSKEDRAGVLSTIYLISYSGAVVPNLVVGRLPKTLSLFQISIGYGVLVAVTCVVTLFTARQDMV